MISMPRWLIPYCFIALGALFFAYGAVHFWRSWTFSERALSAMATVVDVEVEMKQGVFDGVDNKTVKSFRPVVTFQDQTGVERRVISTSASSNNGYEPGTKVPIIYDPHAPDFFRYDDGFDLWIGAAVQTGLGALAFFAGFWLRSLKIARR